MSALRIQTLDNFLPDPAAYREMALAQPFYSVKGPDKEYYHGISVRPTDELQPLLSGKLGKKVSLDYCLLRQNNGDDVHRIHADSAYSDYAFVLFLNPPEQCQGGTAFWRHKQYGFSAWPTEREIRLKGKSPVRVFRQLQTEWQDLSKWEQLHLAEMKWNRCICYPTKDFHSRWPLEGFGTEKENSRLIAIGFFNAN